MTAIPITGWTTGFCERCKVRKNAQKRFLFVFEGAVNGKRLRCSEHLEDYTQDNLPETPIAATPETKK